MKSQLTSTRAFRAAPVRRIALAIAAIAAVILLTPLPAEAGTVTGWGNPQIFVYTGAKNTANRTQYVGSITIRDPAGRCDGGTAEAWVSRPGAIDWYRKRQMCGETTFWVERWVPSGSSVCGSNWFWDPGRQRWFRGITCISIRV